MCCCNGNNCGGNYNMGSFTEYIPVTVNYRVAPGNNGSGMTAFSSNNGVANTEASVANHSSYGCSRIQPYGTDRCGCWW